MSVTNACTTETRIVALAGQLALDLRTDDVADYDAHIEGAIQYATDELLNYYYVDYLESAVADDNFAIQCATFFAVEWLCLHRLNEPSASLEKKCEELRKKLELIRTRKARTRIAKSRRPGVVTNSTVVLRDVNNQVKVDTTRSTGVAQDYRRPNANAPDAR